MRPFTPTPGLLFWSVLYHKDFIEKSQLIQDFEQLYPRVITYSHDYFPMAKYYSKEMGEQTQLDRLFFVSLKPIKREELIIAKKRALFWEEACSDSSKRRFLNIDPGLLTLENVVLSTAKPYGHRIYLADGLYAELCLIYRQGHFSPLEWTYPDYSDGQLIDFFHFVRSFLKKHC